AIDARAIGTTLARRAAGALEGPGLEAAQSSAFVASSRALPVPSCAERSRCGLTPSTAEQRVRRNFWPSRLPVPYDGFGQGLPCSPEVMNVSTHTPPLKNVEIPQLKKLCSGKVREIFAFDQRLLLVATDRISAFDSVLPDPIPQKGAVLTQISRFWF